MSMREYPSSGYTVPLDSLKKAVPQSKHDEFDKVMNDLSEGEIDEDGFREFVDDLLPNDFPAYDIYRVSDEETPDEDNMQRGGYYAIFDESDLYVKAETPQHAAMKKLGVVPTFSRWSVWG